MQARIRRRYRQERNFKALGVLALGALSLFAASVIAPERLYPILGTASGVIVIGLGFPWWKFLGWC
jgi:hypothetical protein